MTNKRKLRKWEMWASVNRLDGERWTPRLSFYRKEFDGLIPRHEQIIRVEVRELSVAQAFQRGNDD